MDKRRGYITLLNVISAVAVVNIHVNAEGMTLEAADQVWITSRIITYCLEFAVPIFFMITGATLMDYRERYDTKEYFLKRIAKTVVPFLGWSIFASFFRFYITKDMAWGGVKDYINRVFSTDYNTNYWFFIPLFSIYISIPLLSAIPSEKRKLIFSFYAIGWFILQSVIPFANEVLDIKLSIPVFVNIGNQYLFYVIVGYLLDRHPIAGRKAHLALYISSVLALILQIFGDMARSIEAWSIVEVYGGYLKPCCIMYSVGIFVFGRELGERIRRVSVHRFLDWFAKYTFPMYLMHDFARRLLIMLFPDHNLGIAWRMLAPVAIILVCISCAYVLRKIPGVRRTVP